MTMIKTHFQGMDVGEDEEYKTVINGLEAPSWDDREMVLFARFLQRSYFRRVWIIQEWAQGSSETATIICGGDEFTRLEFVSASLICLSRYALTGKDVSPAMGLSCVGLLITKDAPDQDGEYTH